MWVKIYKRIYLKTFTTKLKTDMTGSVKQKLDESQAGRAKQQQQQPRSRSRSSRRNNSPILYLKALKSEGKLFVYVSF